MVDNLRNTPTITYIMIDTENKSIEQMIDEVVEVVNKNCNDKLMEVREKLSDEEFEKVKEQIEKERAGMIEQFTYQIINLDEIRQLRD